MNKPKPNNRKPNKTIEDYFLTQDKFDLIWNKSEQL